MTHIGTAAINFNTSRETITAMLEQIAADWATLDIDTPVIDHGEIDPDAMEELATRL